MKTSRIFLTIAFAMFLFLGGLAVNATAQTKGSTTVRRPVIVRQYIVRDPFWNYRYGYYSPYRGYMGYHPYFDSPYYRYQEQKWYLERELAGNRRELQEHLRKYRADGVITAKERRELDDDYKDVRNSEAKLRRFTRNY